MVLLEDRANVDDGIGIRLAGVRRASGDASYARNSHKAFPLLPTSRRPDRAGPRDVKPPGPVRLCDVPELHGLGIGKSDHRSRMERIPTQKPSRTLELIRAGAGYGVHPMRCGRAAGVANEVALELVCIYAAHSRPLPVVRLEGRARSRDDSSSNAISSRAIACRSSEYV